MNRSVWKIPRIIKKQRSEVFHTAEGNTVDSTYLRSAVIGPGAIDQVIQIHNGHKFVRVRITEHFVGYKYGAFALTKKRVHHKQKKKK